MLLIVGGPFVENAKAQQSGMFGVFLLCLICLGGLSIFGFAVYERFLRRGKPFQFFLCHHKAGAGNLARLLKMHLLENLRVHRKVFVDSDDLSDLNELFSYVRTEVDDLVVLCSREVLLRPWCVGEVTTAFLNDVNVVKVILSDFVPPDAAAIEAYGEMNSMFMLAQYGIGTKMIQDALRWFESNPLLRVPGVITNSSMEEFACRLTRRDFGSHPAIAGTVKAVAIPTSNNCTVILADQSNLEATCTACVVAKMLLAFLALDQGVTFVLQQASQMPLGVKHVVLVCTNGVLQKKNIIESLLLVSGLHIEPIVSETAFRFPTPEFCDELTEHVEMLALQPDQMDLNAQEFVALVREIFKEIAIQVDPQASEDLLAVAVRRLASRLRTKPSSRTWSSSSMLGSASIEVEKQDDEPPPQPRGASVENQDGPPPQPPATSVENEDGPTPQPPDRSIENRVQLLLKHPVGADRNFGIGRQDQSIKESL